MEDDFKQEYLLYQRLLGAYHEFPPATSHSSTTGNTAHWESLNNVILCLEKLGHSNYSDFKITLENDRYVGNASARVNISNLRMNMMSVLRMMGAEFRLGDPAYTLSQYKTGDGINMSQNANPHVNASSNQNQEQHQEQTVSLTIEQKLEELQRMVDENLSEEQIEQVREPLETFRQNPTIWKNAQKLIQLGANFSRDVAVQFIGSVLAVAVTGSH